MIINRVENGLVAEQNSVFIAYFTKPSHIYQKNPDCRSWGDDAWFAKVALLGVMVRWDGSFGFVGGKVDPGETLIEAAKRESLEEINHQPKDDDLKLVCSHSMVHGNFKQNTHLYACEVSPEKLYDIRRKSGESVHGQVESAGFVVVHMVKNAPQNLQNNVWAGTALAELNILLESGIIQPYEKVDNGYEYNDPELDLDSDESFADYMETLPVPSSSKSAYNVEEFLEVLKTNYPPIDRNEKGVQFFKELETHLIALLKSGVEAVFEQSDSGCWECLTLSTAHDPDYTESYFFVDGTLTTLIDSVREEHVMDLYIR
jgi:ADP-ribose pyrophosphatase YjhB (NUDIX family)